MLMKWNRKKWVFIINNQISMLCVTWRKKKWTCRSAQSQPPCGPGPAAPEWSRSLDELPPLCAGSRHALAGAEPVTMRPRSSSPWVIALPSMSCRPFAPDRAMPSLPGRSTKEMVDNLTSSLMINWTVPIILIHSLIRFGISKDHLVLQK